MTNITMDALNRGWNVGFVTDAARALREALKERSRRRREFRTIEADLRQYSRDEITRADIWHITNEATQYDREEEFRSALDNYIADYKKHRAASGVDVTV
jgi:hypothetical protein